MSLIPRLLIVFLSLLALVPQAACLLQPIEVERRLDQSFPVTAGSTVQVNLSGGNVAVVPGPPGSVHILLQQFVRTNRDDKDVEELLARYEISAVQDGGGVRLVAKKKSMFEFNFRWVEQVRMTATVTAPPDQKLDLDTSGGRIDVRGDWIGDVRADTSGGSISVEGGSGPIVLSTSGGSIKVGRALHTLHAGTSGGQIDVSYVGPAASEIDLDTSGGSIHVGLDPLAALSVSADTSGGSVSIDGLPFEGTSLRREHASGTLNGGGAGRLRVNTSGGSIALRASSGERTRSSRPGPSDAKLTRILVN